MTEQLRKAHTEWQNSPTEANEQRLQDLAKEIVNHNPDIRMKIIDTITRESLISNTFEQCDSIRNAQQNSITAIIDVFKEKNMSATDVQHFLDNMPRTVFVFTAHPTETKSLAVIQQLGKIAGPYLARQEGWQDELSKEVATFLKTDLALDKPSAENEIKRGIYYMDEAVFNALPEFLDEDAKRTTQGL